MKAKDLFVIVCTALVTALAAGKDVFFTLQVDKQVIRAAGFFVPVDKTQNKLAALQAN